MFKRLNIFFLLFSLVPVFALKLSSTSDIAVVLEMLGNAKSDGVELKVEVKNLSKKPITVLKERRWDYKWEKIKSLGNYIIELEKSEDGKFQLFPPSADIDFFHLPGDYIKVASLNTIIDTLYVDGGSFSRYETKKKGFPSGNYRVRVSFNASEWSSSQENSSDWILFKIE